jgi:hypothetical protein
MTRTFHIMAKDEWRKYINYFHPMYGSHYIDLPSGKILVAVSFMQEASEDYFEANAVRNSLPHPVWNGNDTINAEHVEELHDLFEGATIEEKKAAASKATKKDVAARASKIHPLLRMRSW